MEETFFRFSNLTRYPEIIHGISNRSFGDMKFGGKATNGEVIKNREQFCKNLGIDIKNVITCNQVHSNNVVIVGKGDVNSEIHQTDGLISSEKGAYLMLKTADCLPILMYDPEKRIVCAVHAGWRGILAQILPYAIKKLIDAGSNPESLIVGVGPGICQKHFIVRDSVLQEFLKKYPQATFVRNKDGYVDLIKAVTSDLKKAGVTTQNIETSKYCTYCDNGIYGSFRKEGEGALEMASIIGIK